jgi:hypothetical protein
VATRPVTEIICSLKIHSGIAVAEKKEKDHKNFKIL